MPKLLSLQRSRVFVYPVPLKSCDFTAVVARMTVKASEINNSQHGFEFSWFFVLTDEPVLSGSSQVSLDQSYIILGT